MPDNSDDPASNTPPPADDSAEATVGYGAGDNTVPTTTLFANKYDSVEALEKGYIELQKKQGTVPDDTGDPSASPPDNSSGGNPLTLNADSTGADQGGTSSSSTTPKTASELLDSFEDSYATTGELDAKQVKALEKKGMTEADAKLLLDTRKQQADAYIDKLLEPVGGRDEWTKVQDFLLSNMEQDKQDEFNEAMTTGNTLMKSLLIQHAKDTYEQANGAPPKGQTQGDSSKVGANTDIFHTQVEMAKAVGDTKYRTDPAYRAEVDAKISRSDLEVMNGYRKA